VDAPGLEFEALGPGGHLRPVELTRGVGAKSRIDILMFVAGEPGSGEQPGWKTVGFMDGLIRQRAAKNSAGDSPPPGATGKEPWHFPPETIRHINLVVEVADRERRGEPLWM